jgi:hypothetical protein
VFTLWLRVRLETLARATWITPLLTLRRSENNALIGIFGPSGSSEVRLLALAALRVSEKFCS